jgi:anti-sigma factor RsiW
MAAAVDNELSPRQRRALDRHVASCASCQRELAATERMLASVAALPMEATVSARLEQDTLRRVRIVASDEAEAGERSSWWRSIRVPVMALASAAVLALAIGITRESTEVRAPERADQSPQARSVPAPAAPAPEARVASRPVPSPPPEELPPALAARPDLFVELPILRNLEKLENFEAIRTTTLDSEPTAPTGTEERSNG